MSEINSQTPPVDTFIAEEPSTDLPATNETPKVELPDTKEETPVVEKVVVKPQNVTQAFDTFSSTIPFKEGAETVPLPSDFVEVVSQNIENVPNTKLNDTPASANWAKVLQAGQELSSFDNAFRTTLENPDALFEQQVQSSGGPLLAAHSQFKDAPNEVLRGERGILRLMGHLGLGSIFRVPLWNTGITVSIKAPSEAALLELNRLNVADKISLGRRTYGLAFSNMTTVIADRLTTFVLDHLYQSNLKTEEDLRTIISCHDLPVLIWGIANAIYPQGFQYERACSCNPDKCQHVVRERLNLSKICWTNTRALTPWQVAHMSNVRQNSVTIESVKRYKEELLSSQKRQIELDTSSGNKIKMTLRVPVISEYLESGHRWITDITTMVNRALGIDAQDSERNNYILTQGQASAMRQYVHWVECVEFSENKIEDKETLEQTFNLLSSDDTLRDAFMKEIAKYINDTAVSVIGIPTYNCPKCQGEQKAPLATPHNTNIIPIDVYQTFFTLLVQRLQRIQIR